MKEPIRIKSLGNRDWPYPQGSFHERWQTTSSTWRSGAKPNFLLLTKGIYELGLSPITIRDWLYPQGIFHDRWQTTSPTWRFRSQTSQIKIDTSLGISWSENSAIYFLKTLLKMAGVSATLRQSANWCGY